jgi:raffinose/stachyose/melibiose transport system permease protein
MRRLKGKGLILGSVSLVVSFFIFVVPFLFVIAMAGQSAEESYNLNFKWPEQPMYWENFQAVLVEEDYMLVRSFINSTMLTLFSVTILIVLAAFAAWVIERRPGRMSKIANALILSGLMIPPSVMPTIFLLQGIGIYGTFPSMVLIEVAYTTAFTMMAFRAYIRTIPKEIDEAAIIDGAGPIALFWKIAMPLMKPVVVTTIILNSVFVFNDFVNPIYFMNGPGNETIQLTLFNFQSQYRSRFNLLFMDVLVITIPMVLLFAFFNKRIISGMTAGSVKG